MMQCNRVFSFIATFMLLISVGCLNADFSADVTAGPAPLTVHFKDKSTLGTSPITEWYWFFTKNDFIEYSEEQNPVITFEEEGYYDVELFVFTNDYADSHKKIGFISVTSPEETPSDDPDTPAEDDFKDPNLGPFFAYWYCRGIILGINAAAEGNGQVSEEGSRLSSCADAIPEVFRGYPKGRLCSLVSSDAVLATIAEAEANAVSNPERCHQLVNQANQELQAFSDAIDAACPENMDPGPYGEDAANCAFCHQEYIEISRRISSITYVHTDPECVARRVQRVVDRLAAPDAQQYSQAEIIGGFITNYSNEAITLSNQVNCQDCGSEIACIQAAILRLTEMLNAIPPAEGENVPPAEGENVPPAEGENVPPAEGENVPPAEGEYVPPDTSTRLERWFKNQLAFIAMMDEYRASKLGYTDALRKIVIYRNAYHGMTSTKHKEHKNAWLPKIADHLLQLYGIGQKASSSDYERGKQDARSGELCAAFTSMEYMDDVINYGTDAASKKRIDDYLDGFADELGLPRQYLDSYELGAGDGYAIEMVFSED